MLFVGCTKTIPPDTQYIYNTEIIRNLWILCNQGFQHKNPFLDEITRWQTCDCYTDTIRETYAPKELIGMSELKGKELAKLLINKCNPKNNIQNPT